MAPLSDKDRSAHKLGNLNERNVRNVLHAILLQYNYKLIHLWECGLLIQNEKPWLATSLDGWIVCRPSNNSEEGDQSNFHIGLEIKTPSSKKILDKVRTYRDAMGTTFTCNLGNDLFHSLVYDQDYKVQILHHAAVCGFNSILFVVADSVKIIYCVWVNISDLQRQNYISTLEITYDDALKWAFEGAFTANDPKSEIPEF